MEMYFNFGEMGTSPWGYLKLGFELFYLHNSVRFYEVDQNDIICSFVRCFLRRFATQFCLFN